MPRGIPADRTHKPEMYTEIQAYAYKYLRLHASWGTKV